MEVPGKIHVDVSERCEPCITEGKTNEAAGYCEDCNEFMCHECFQHHLKSKRCSSHSLSQVGHGMVERKHEECVTQYCNGHTNQPLRYYCQSHDEIACGDCIVAKHHGCKMQIIQDIAKNFKESPEYKVLMEEIQQIEHENEECETQNQELRDKNKTLTETSLKEVQKFRNKFNEHLDTGGTEIVVNVKRLSEENENNLSELQEKIATVHRQSTEIRSTIDLNTHNDALLFIRHIEIKPALNDLKRSIADIKSRNQIILFAFQPDYLLEDFVGTHLNLGTLKILSKDQYDSNQNDALVGQGLSSNGTNEDSKTQPVRKEATQHIEIKRDNMTSKVSKQLSEGLRQRGLIVSIKPSAVVFPESAIWKTHVLKSKDVKTDCKIGEGRFGHVYIGNYKEKEGFVAVKVIEKKLSEDERKQLFLEGAIFDRYKHPNIENFLGTVVEKKTVMIVMEYLSGGNLLQYLRAHGKEQSRFRATHMCLDIASGMEYLAKNDCIHMDLQANKCLIGNKHVAKISALGMTTNKEVTLSEKFSFPVKWSAPEAWTKRKITTASDVWSYGVLMWEIFSNGQQPYPSWDLKTTANNVVQGYRLFAPPKTPDSIYQLMLKCWDIDPLRRITIESLRKRLTAIVINPPEDDDWE